MIYKMTLRNSYDLIEDAPLLVLWFGYELTPKVILVVIIVFFPITVSLLDGFQSADPDTISLMRSMGASKMQFFLRSQQLPIIQDFM